MAIQSVGELAAKVRKDPQLVAELKQDPAGALERMAGPIPDTWPYRLVIAFLGLVSLVAALGYVVLSMRGVQEVPDGLVALGSAALGALAGMLAPSPAS